MWYLSYWILPLIAACTWLGTLLAMLITWLVQGSPRYPSMEAGQHIAYISDIGAQGLKPLFIAGSAVCVVLFDLSFILERWFRHTGKLTRNTTRNEKIMSICAIICSIVGAAGLILLTIFDTLRYPNVHDAMLYVFIVAYVISAIFICAEYGLLGAHVRNHPILKWSFYVKLMFIIVEIGVIIAFAVMQRQSHWNRSAILEWVIALIYIFYVLSFFLDFIPAVHGNHRQSQETTLEMAEDDAAADRQRGYDGQSSGRNGYANGYTNGNGYPNGNAGYTNGSYRGTNGYANGYTNGHSHGGLNGATEPPNSTGIRDGVTYYPDGHPNYKPQRPVGSDHGRF